MTVKTRLILALPLAGAITMLTALGMLGALNHPAAWESPPPPEADEPIKVNVLDLDRWVWIVCGCSPVVAIRPEKAELENILGAPDSPVVDAPEPELPPIEANIVFGPSETQMWDGFVAPRNWAHCLAKAPGGGRVQVQFDVTPTGNAENVEVIFSTHPCFEPSTRRSVEQSTFPALVKNGVASWQYGRKLTIVFAAE